MTGDTTAAARRRTAPEPSHRAVPNVRRCAPAAVAWPLVTTGDTRHTRGAEFREKRPSAREHHGGPPIRPREAADAPRH